MAIRTRGAIIRSRTNWQLMAERPTKYFLNLEKTNFSKKMFYRIRREDGSLIQGQNKVLGEIRQYYNRLYTSQRKIDKAFTNNLDIPQISEELRNELDKPLSLTELGVALKDLANSKCPGIDGLSTDFIKCFWPKIKDVFYDMILETVEDGSLPLTARQGILSLLEKWVGTQSY